MRKRINIVLPETTIETIDRIAKTGQRSRFIDEAVKHFVSYRSTAALRSQLERAAIRDQDLDREIAADWLVMDQQAWQKLSTQENKKPTTRDAAKSTSLRSTRH